MSSDHYDSPNTDSIDSDQTLHSNGRWLIHLAKAAAIFGAALVVAIIAVPLLYQAISLGLWGMSMAVFAGLPALVGMRWGKPSRIAGIAAGALVLTCPAIYALADRLPTDAEILRDAYFLATASAVTFVSAGWTGSLFRACDWRGAFVAALLLVCGSGAVALLTCVFVYLV